MRSQIGRILFDGNIPAKNAKIKIFQVDAIEQKKFKIKFTALVSAKSNTGSDQTSAKFAIEHLEAKFMNQIDMENF